MQTCGRPWARSGRNWDSRIQRRAINGPSRSTPTWVPHTTIWGGCASNTATALRHWPVLWRLRSPIRTRVLPVSPPALPDFPSCFARRRRSRHAERRMRRRWMGWRPRRRLVWRRRSAGCNRSSYRIRGSTIGTCKRRMVNLPAAQLPRRNRPRRWPNDPGPVSGFGSVSSAAFSATTRCSSCSWKAG